MNPDKLRLLESTIAAIRNDFGSDSVSHNSAATLQVPHVSTGSISVDVALGIGGFPRSHIVEIFGEPSTGKTTLGLMAIAQAQRQGGLCAYIDSDGMFNPSWARRLGVNIAELTVIPPQLGEDTFEITERLLHSKALDIIMADSVTSLISKAEFHGQIGDSEQKHYLHAQLMSAGLRRVNKALRASGSVLIFTNQMRFRENHMDTTGGNALKYYASVRIQTSILDSVKEGESRKGDVLGIDIVRNKLAPPFGHAEIRTHYHRGYDRAFDVAQCAIREGAIKKLNKQYCYKDRILGTSGKDVIAALQQDQGLVDLIELELRQHFGFPVSTPVDSADGRPSLRLA